MSRFALLLQLAAFDRQVLLTFEHLDAVAAQQFHLRGKLVLPGGHLLKLMLKGLGGLHERVTLAAGGDERGNQIWEEEA